MKRGKEITGWVSLMLRLLSDIADKTWEVKASDLETFLGTFPGAGTQIPNMNIWHQYWVSARTYAKSSSEHDH